MAPRHIKLAAYERELIGLVQAVKHRRAYFWGRMFVVKTDHYSLKYLLDQCQATIPQHQWVSKLMGFDFAVEYKPGTRNTVADALSWRSEEFVELTVLSTPAFTVFDTLRTESEEVAALRQLKEEIVASGCGDKWRVVNGIITRVSKVYMPADSAHLPAILSAVHDTGHEGAEKTLNKLHHDFYVSGAWTTIQEHVHTCAVYQLNKVEHLHPAGLLQPLDIPSNVWSHITMDFIEGFPRINGKSIILTVVDRFSKYAHLVHIGHPNTATSVAKVFFDSVVWLHGILESIMNDRC
jgi:hypothetical protein